MITKDVFLEKSNEGLTYSELAEFFNVSKRTISNWEKKTGVKSIRNTVRKNFFNEDYFEKVDCEDKAYILGFIMADGFIDKAEKALSFTLSSKDREILDIINDKFDSTAIIREAKRDRITLNLCSKKLVNDLIKYGIVRNKTRTLFLPNIPNDLKRHLLRGYFDGDGHIGHRQCALIVSSEIFKDDLYKFLTKNNFPIPHERKNSNSYKLTFSRKHSDFIKFMYKDSNIFLPRKKELYNEFWLSYESGRSRG